MMFFRSELFFEQMTYRFSCVEDHRKTGTVDVVSVCDALIFEQIIYSTDCRVYSCIIVELFVSW